MIKRKSDAARFALNGVAFAAACLWGSHAAALGLGRLNVQSALGETLRAEIDVTSISPEEAASLQVRVAPAQAYRAAGVEYNAVLPSASVQLVRRDGRSVLRLSSDRAVLEPFVDVIIEATWASGRLVREYTLLFDPPASIASRGAQPAAPTTSPVLSAAPAPAPTPLPPSQGATTNPALPRSTLPPVATTPAVPSQRRAATATPSPSPSPSASPSSAPAPSPLPSPAPAAPGGAADPVRGQRALPPAEPPAAAARQPVPAPAPSRAPSPSAATTPETVRVRPGETLYRIAGDTQRPGVSLDQMLVSLFRANPQAFIGDNMNRLRAGAVLSVPSADEARRVGDDQAREVINAQSADFDAYRQRLATGTTTQAAATPSRRAGGQVQAQVDDRRQSAAPTPDRLTLSQGAGKTPETDARSPGDGARRDSNARIAELARNVEELKRLQSGGVAPPPPATAPATATTPPAGGQSPAGGAGSGGAAATGPSATAPAATSPTTAAAPAVASPPTANDPAGGAAIPPSSTVAGAGASPDPSAPGAAASGPGATVVAAAPPAAARPPASPSATPEPPAERGWLASLTDNALLLPLAGVLIALLAGLALWRLRGRMRRQEGETSFLESRLQPDSFFGVSGGQRIDTLEPAMTAPAGASSMSYSLSQLDAIGDVDPVAEADVYLAYGRDLQAEEILKEAMRANPDRMAIRTKLLEVYAKRRDVKGFELLATQLHNLTGGQGEDWEKAQSLGQSVDPENPLYQPGGRPQEVLGAQGLPVEALGASTVPFTTQAAAPTFQPAADATLDAGHGIDLELDLPGAPDSASRSAGGHEAFELGALDSTFPTIADAPPASIAVPAPSPSSTSSFGTIDFDLGDFSPMGAPAPAPARVAPVDTTLDFGEFDVGGDAAAAADQEPLARKIELAEEFRQIGDLEGARDLLEEVLAKADGALRAKAQGMLDKLA